MGKKYEEIEKSSGVAVAALPIAGAVVRVFGSIALEALREYSRFVDTQELRVFIVARDLAYTTSVAHTRIKALCSKLAMDGAQS